MSDDDNDNVLYGTKFTNEATQGKVKHLQDQIVTDKNGKRRFHGAFTGGFSAGYFNSVGSKEGFAPTSFSSSRTSRQSAKTASVDTYMDDEDISAFGIAPRNIGKSSDYESDRESSTDAILSIMSVNRDGKGVKLMRAMGWKPGFGVGPRKQVVKKEVKKSVYTCEGPPGAENKADESEEEDIYTIGLYMAPKDTGQLALLPHSTTCGLDYTGISGAPTPSSGAGVASVAGFSGEAFGVGAFEEQEEFSVYSSDKKSNYSSYIDDDNTQCNVHITHKYNSTLRNYLENYVSGRKDKYLRESYPPPVLPPGYKSWHTPTDTAGIPSTSAPPNVAKSVQERALRLGIKEEPAATIQPTSSFQPFLSNTPKQERYQLFQQGKDVDYSASGLTEWDQQREQEEFGQSAKFFKPLSFDMSNRFASAGTSTEADEKKKLEEEAERERSEAVSLKMFGRLTRETHQWCPANLLCKRFNVKNPNPEIQSVGTIRRFNPVLTYTKPALSQYQEDVERPATDEEDSTKDGAAGDSQIEGDSSVAEQLEQDQDQKLESKIEEKLDLFKSIFADSDDEEEEEETGIEDDAEATKEVKTEPESKSNTQQIKIEVLEVPDNSPPLIDLTVEPDKNGDHKNDVLKSEKQEELTPVTVPLPPNLENPPIIFNPDRYSKNQEASENLEKALLETLKEDLAKSSKKKEKKKKSDKKKKEKKSKKKKSKKSKKKKHKKVASVSGESRSPSPKRRSGRKSSRSRSRSRSYSPSSYSRSYSRSYTRSRSYDSRSRSVSCDRYKRSRSNSKSRYYRGRSKERSRSREVYKRSCSRSRSREVYRRSTSRKETARRRSRSVSPERPYSSHSANRTHSSSQDKQPRTSRNSTSSQDPARSPRNRKYSQSNSPKRLHASARLGPKMPGRPSPIGQNVRPRPKQGPGPNHHNMRFAGPRPRGSNQYPISQPGPRFMQSQPRFSDVSPQSDTSFSNMHPSRQSQPRFSAPSLQSQPRLLPASPQSQPRLLPASPQSQPRLLPASQQSQPRLLPASPQSQPRLLAASPQSQPRLLAASPQSLPRFPEMHPSRQSQPRFSAPSPQSQPRVSAPSPQSQHRFTAKNERQTTLPVEPLASSASKIIAPKAETPTKTKINISQIDTKRKLEPDKKPKFAPKRAKAADFM